MQSTDHQYNNCAVLSTGMVMSPGHSHHFTVAQEKKRRTWYLKSCVQGQLSIIDLCVTHCRQLGVAWGQGYSSYRLFGFHSHHLL